MKNIIAASFLMLILWAVPAAAVELTGTLNQIIIEEHSVIIDLREYFLAEDAVIRMQSDPNKLVLPGPMLHGRSVLYDLFYVGQQPTVKKLVILDIAQ